MLQCDKDGNITQNINIGYQEGTVFTRASILTPSANDSTNSSSIDNEKFNFKCSEINDCYNQVMIVKKSLSK